jgi:hypothetical protein
MQPENIEDMCVNAEVVLKVNILPPLFVVLPLLKLVQPLNIFDILVINVRGEIFTFWLNAAQLENIEDTFVNAEEFNQLNGFDALFVVLPLLKLVQPLNIFDIVVIPVLFEIVTFWLNAAQPENIYDTFVNVEEVVKEN